MSISRYQPGQALHVNGATWIINRKLATGAWQLERRDTGELLNMTTLELNKGLLARTVQFILNEPPMPPRPGQQLKFPNFGGFDTLKPHLQTAAKYRLHMVQAVMKAGPVVATEEHFAPIVKAAHVRLPRSTRPHKPHWQTVYRWYVRYMQGGQDIMCLVPHHHLRGSTEPKKDEDVTQLVDKAIEKVYLQQERKSIAATHSYLRTEIDLENRKRPTATLLELPGIGYVRKRILAIPFIDRLIARFGRGHAHRRLRNVRGHHMAESPLQYVEIDHTVCDVIVLDDDSSIPLGRPHLTVAIDVYTRCILGIYISFNPPSTLSVFRCLRHAFLPKSDLHEQYPSIKGTWDPHGVMAILVVDNGLEFHSRALQDLAARFNITIQFCPRKQPWYKPHVERFIGTFNRGLCHTIPGTTYSNIFDKDEYDSKKKAVLRLSTFRELVHIWIVDEYHQTPHRILHDAPINMWRNHPGTENPFMPTDPLELDALFCTVETYKLTHKGVVLHGGLHYGSDELHEIRKRWGDKLDVQVRYDEGNLGYVFVDNPFTGECIRVPALNLDYANGLTLWQHDKIKAYAREHMNGCVDQLALAQAKRKIAEIIEREFKLTRSRRSKVGIHAARHKTTGAAEKPVPATPAAQSGPGRPDLHIVGGASVADGPQQPAWSPEERERELRRSQAAKRKGAVGSRKPKKGSHG